MDGIIINYRHMGEDNSDYLLHMDNKGRIDRMCPCPSVWRWK